MFFYEIKPLNFVAFILLINFPFINIIFIIYVLYSYNVNNLYRRLTKFFFLPIWAVLYLVAYSTARQYYWGR